MNEQEKLAKEISRFLEGEMPSDELKDFEDRIERDHVLAGEVTIYRNLLGAMQEVGMEDLNSKLRQRLDEKSLDEKPEVDVINHKIRKYLRIAFIVIVLIALIAIWIFSSNRSDSVKLSSDCSTRSIAIKGTEDLGTGFAGTPNPDLIVLQVCPTNLPEGEYWFRDSMKLFVQKPQQWGELEFRLVVDKGRYELVNQGITYPLKRNTRNRQKLIAE